MVAFLIVLAIEGLVVGGLARLALPGRQPIGCLATMICGILGSFVAGFILWGITGRHEHGWIASILGAMLVVWLYGRTSRRSYY